MRQGDMNDIKEKHELLKDVDNKFKELEQEKKKNEQVIQARTKRRRIGPRLIAEHCVGLTVDWTKEPIENIVDQVMNVAVIKLDRLQLDRIENLECYTNVTHVYLQHNEIQELSDQFQCLPNLLFLVLFNNKITEVNDELRECSKLEVLDLSYNNITKIKIDALPTSLLSLNISHNVIENENDILTRIMNELPNLIELNEVTITKRMREEKQFITTDASRTTSISEDSVDGLESCTIDKLRQSHSRLLGATQTTRKNDTLDFNLGKLPFWRDTPTDLEQRRSSHNSTMYQELLNQQQQLQNQRMKTMQEELEQLKLRVNKKALELRNNHTKQGANRQGS